MRLQKFLSQAGVASRRQAERFIQDGRIKVNHKVMTEMGQMIDPKVDLIHFDDKPVALPLAFQYIALNKPEGYIVSRGDTHRRQTIYDLLPEQYQHLHPVGRLDQDSCGLLLLTDNGEWTQKLLHPKYKVVKTYIVRVKGKVSTSVLKRLTRPMTLNENLKVKGAWVNIIERTKDYTELEFHLKEGKKRQIRRMCSACRLEVIYLHRTSIGNLDLGDLAEGKTKALSPTELEEIFKKKQFTSTPKKQVKK